VGREIGTAKQEVGAGVGSEIGTARQGMGNGPRQSGHIWGRG
jgi:hypothetical protein